MANLQDVAASVEKRAKRKLARGTVTRTLPVFDGQYVGRFGVLAMERIRAIEQAVEGDISDDESVDIAAGFIADSCRVILARPDAGAKLEPLAHSDGRPVRFDEGFAEALGLEPAPGREAFTGMHDVVLACWTVEEEDGARALNVPALNVFSIALLEWMQDTSRLVEGELVGESNGSRP
jgi:hypothetical protein